jgi:hypothetical protein
MAQICREYAVADDLVCHWKQVFLERAPELFRVKQHRSEDQERIAELERLVPRLAQRGASLLGLLLTAFCGSL